MLATRSHAYNHSYIITPQESLTTTTETIMKVNISTAIGSHLYIHPGSCTEEKYLK